MREIDKRTQVRRRSFLRGAATAPAAATLAAAGASITPEAAWATDVKNLTPAVMTTLVRAARDIYPHDQLADRFYIVAVAPYDDKAGTDGALKALLVEGCAALDREAGARFDRDYVAVPNEDQRVQILQAVSATPFFQKLRGDLVVALYNQKEVWPKFGYEGSSFEKGGYIRRGFNDLDWLPEV